MTVRMLRLLLIMSLVTQAACARHLPGEQRRECQQRRTRAAMRGVFMPVGIVVVALFYMIPGVGESRDGGDERRSDRRERRRHRREVCRDIQRPLTPVADTDELPDERPVLPPPDEERLGAALRAVEADVRACLPNARDLLVLDAGLHGPSGRVTSFELEGEGVAPGHRACLERVMRTVRFDPFEGAMRVRWSINLSNQRLPAPWLNSDTDSDTDSATTSEPGSE